MINAFIGAPTTVETGANLLFTGTRAATRASQMCNGGWLYHADGSGQFLITKPGIYKVDFTGVVTAAAAGEIELEVRTNGEALTGLSMAEAIAAADDPANVAAQGFIVVPCMASITVTVANVSGTDITVNSASLTLSRVC